MCKVIIVEEKGNDPLIVINALLEMVNDHVEYLKELNLYEDFIQYSNEKQKRSHEKCL